MPAYVRTTAASLCRDDPASVVGRLAAAHANDGFAMQYLELTRSWVATVEDLQRELKTLMAANPSAGAWAVLLEYPLYRLRKRIDVVVIAGNRLFVVEVKTGVTRFQAADRRQVEEYALDLRDFHAASRNLPIVPVLWCPDAEDPEPPLPTPEPGEVSEIVRVGKRGLGELMAKAAPTPGIDMIDPVAWDTAAYEPVPTIVEAATAIFAGHNVRDIARADADNLDKAASRVVELVATSRSTHTKSLVFVTGVPGAGKTLAGLQAVHDAVASGADHRGDIVYLSGNTPLVRVLREALARDEHRRAKAQGATRRLDDIRREIRTRVQHVNDFLKNAVEHPGVPPHEHAVVFDEAQRAWDAAQGKKKFGRHQSEPALILEIMGRHDDWCTCICLIGSGQEINTGESGIEEWAKALRSLDPQRRREWTVYAPPGMLTGGNEDVWRTLGRIPEDIDVRVEPQLALTVPMRSYRSPQVSEWVDAVLDGDQQTASRITKFLASYPMVLTRSRGVAKHWLRKQGRGFRRYGMVASSGARRLRAKGYGLTLGATDGQNIAHWYLNPPGDIRSSYALEVPANEYACQGLELDFVGVCWDVNLLWSGNQWHPRRLSGPKWQDISSDHGRRHLINSYRVLLTRAREGVVIWVPRGSAADDTRKPEWYDATAEFLIRCGARSLDRARDVRTGRSFRG